VDLSLIGVEGMAKIVGVGPNRHTGPDPVDLERLVLQILKHGHCSDLGRVLLAPEGSPHGRKGTVAVAVAIDLGGRIARIGDAVRSRNLPNKLSKLRFSRKSTRMCGQLLDTLRWCLRPGRRVRAQHQAGYSNRDISQAHAEPPGGRAHCQHNATFA
jgi:hypothetical protein